MGREQHPSFKAQSPLQGIYWAKLWIFETIVLPGNAKNKIIPCDIAQSGKLLQKQSQWAKGLPDPLNHMVDT